MNNIITLAIVAFVISLMSYKKTNGEIMSCTFITSSLLCISSILLFTQSIVWGTSISEKALILLSFGLLAVFLGEFNAQALYKKQAQTKRIVYKYFSFKYCNILLCIYILFTILYAMEIKRLGSMLGFNDLTAIGEVKANMEELNDSMNPIIRQSYKIVTSAGYIHSLIFANNVFLIKKRWYKECKHLIPFICTIFITLASGGRLNIFKVMMGLIFISYIVLRESSQWQKKYIGKIFKIGVPFVFGFVILFSSVSLIVKSNADTREKSAVFDYISYYAGSPIQVFDIKVKDGREKWSFSRFGNYTFSGIYKILGFNEDAKADKIGKGMVYLGGLSNKAGNAQTIFGAAYQDFGFIGMLLFMYITYFIFCKYYYKNILNSYSSYCRNKKLLIYTYCYVSIIVMAFYDNCFWILLSTTGLLTLIVLLFMYWFYFKKLIIKN
ncbi:MULTISPECIES: O-antigen polymerase [Bacteroides]|uniref:O-antigen polymerase n=1 Tax=Bacteroides TaxID=816 RepID=UPI000B397FC0|nr:MULTISPECIES: O-antigen polymerase [Bacteroides]MBM6946177.1 oligosaccharide repeat unit polymerase [Bacteroides gallinaceum]OUO54937.1 hypothetical protein B5F78_10935 [Bacteroides sp. An279]